MFVRIYQLLIKHLYSSKNFYPHLAIKLQNLLYKIVVDQITNNSKILVVVRSKQVSCTVSFGNGQGVVRSLV